MKNHIVKNNKIQSINKSDNKISNVINNSTFKLNIKESQKVLLSVI